MKKIFLCCFLSMSLLLGGCSTKKEVLNNQNTSQGQQQEETKEETKEEVIDKIKWKFQLEGQIQSSPAITGKTLIVADSNGIVYGIDIEKQEAVWKTQLKGVSKSAIIVDEKACYVFINNILYALDSATGNLIWEFDSKVGDNEIVDKYDYYEAIPRIHNDKIYIGTSTGTIYGIDKANGKEVFNYSTEEKYPIRVQPWIEKNIIYFADTRGIVYGVNLDTKKLEFEYYSGGCVHSSPVVYDETLFFAGRSTRINAFNIKNGEEKWTYKDPKGSWFTGDIVENKGIIYVPGSDNHEVLGLDRETGQVKYNLNVNNNVFTKPVIENDMIYITSFDCYTEKEGELHIFNLKTGEKVGEIKFEESMLFSPILKDDVLYVGSNDKYIYAIDVKN